MTSTTNECTDCWPGTSGVCKQDNGVCWDYIEGTTTCPGGTILCPPVTSGSTTTTPPPTPQATTTTPTPQPTIVVGGSSGSSPGTTPAPTIATTTPVAPTVAPVGTNAPVEYWTTDNIALIDMISQLNYVQYRIDNELLLYKTPQNIFEPSQVYKYNDMIQSLMVMSIDGVASKTFYVGPGSPSTSSQEDPHIYGLVNLAAFLAQSMKETIQYDACDENSWDLIDNIYPLSNACGQLSQSYQDYECTDDEKHMECPLDASMTITAVTNAKWYGAPAPLFCQPKSSPDDFTGMWDYTYHCNNPWKDPPEICDDYPGQLAGRYDNSQPIANAAGRTDVENCCWWGRGVIQTTGRCNFGKLNYFLGARAAADGRTSRYPSIDFCQDPEAICSSEEYKELKWVAGMFYWIESVQSYSIEGWDYMTEIVNFVNGGMTDDSFIDAISGIVNRGCHNPPCGTGDVDGGPERRSNFYKALDVFTNIAGTIPPATLPPKPGQGSSDYGTNSMYYPGDGGSDGDRDGYGGTTTTQTNGVGVGNGGVSEEEGGGAGVKASSLANPMVGMGVGIAICFVLLIFSFGIVMYRRRHFHERTRKNIMKNLNNSNAMKTQDDDDDVEKDNGDDDEMWSPTEEELGLEEGSGGSRSSDVEKGEQEEGKINLNAVVGSVKKESDSQVHGVVAPKRKISSNSHNQQENEKQEVVAINAPRRLRSKQQELLQN